MLYLSQPDVTELEVERVTAALRSGWVAPLGPEVDGFESDIRDFCEIESAVALSSGTSALHLGLKALGVGQDDLVIVPTLTFGATAFAVTYTGARPVFVDVERDSWNLDQEALVTALKDLETRGERPSAIVTVDVFGRPCNYRAILDIAREHDIPVLADAAESLGATFGEAPVGAFGAAAVFSFNGNKIMTTSGGGMLVSDDRDLVEKVRFWSTQSREQAPWYQHEEIGYNCRMSNVLAALGRAQLQRLPEMMARRRSHFDLYLDRLGAIEGVTVVGDPPWGQSNMWLTTALFDPSLHPDAPRRIREILATHEIESRPVWKPMHQQPVFAGEQCYLTGVADELFRDGLCLPSGSTLTGEDIDRVCSLVTRVLTDSL